MNRLADATSPYLLQHAGNPVDWFPWGDEALARARDEDRPIFLSIGYAACHWCHVMERESFEDRETAAYLNANFVPIKVDREERPDLDAIYMDAVQALTGQGGWPLSAFLTPEGRPFFAGTYFPKEPGHGLPSFRQVLEGIAQSSSLGASAEPLSEELTARAFDALRSSFDGRWGGFGSAPKFPQPPTLEFVLRMVLRGTPDAERILTLTLDRMASGGMHDQVGGGFSRYSTDPAWHVPHFETMLYDNAQLAQLYQRAWRVTGNDRYRRVATHTLEYLLREMRHPDGGFFSSQDADSEGVEGKFFVWSWEELLELVGEDAARAFGATPEGNWEGTNVLWLADGEEPSDVDLDAARKVLFEAREQRVRPATDDKVLAGWNAMAIQAFAEAGRAFGNDAFVEVARSTADFVLEHLRDRAGKLLRSWREGVAGGPAYADDHALFASALLTLFAATGELRWFGEASGLTEQLVERFLDRERGGFFQNAADADPLVIRPKELYDNALPSGNSAAADVLLRMSLLTGDAELERTGISAIGVIRDTLVRAPTVFGHALGVVDLALGPSREVAVIGAPDRPETRTLTDEVLAHRFLPNAVLAVASPGDREAEAAVALLRDRGQVDGRPTAYVCERFACLLPVTTPEELAEQLAQLRR